MNHLLFTRNLVFYLISYFLIITIYIPYSDDNIKYLIPLIEAAFIYYFYIFSPKKPLLIFILLISIISDAINDYLIGSNALIFFLTIKLFNIKEKLFIYKTFSEIWLVFGIFIIEFQIIKFVIIHYINGNIVNFETLIINIISTIILYPLMHNLFYQLSKLLPENNK